MTTLDSMLLTMGKCTEDEGETKSKNSDRDVLKVLTYGDSKGSEEKCHELPYSDGQRRVYSFE